MKPLPPGPGLRARNVSREDCEPAFYAAANVLARKIAMTSERLAGQGVRCVARFALAIRPEVAAMRESLLRAINGAAPTEPAIRRSGLAPMACGTAPTEPSIRRSGLAPMACGTAPTEPVMLSSRGGLAASPASGLAPTEPSMSTFPGPIGQRNPTPPTDPAIPAFRGPTGGKR